MILILASDITVSIQVAAATLSDSV